MTKKQKQEEKIVAKLVLKLFNYIRKKASDMADNISSSQIS